MTFLLTRMLTDSEETEDFGACWLVQAHYCSQVWQHVPKNKIKLWYILREKGDSTAGEICHKACSWKNAS